MYSDLDSGDEEESQHSRTNAKTMNTTDEVDESKFFAGVFTSQRSEEELAEYVDTYIFSNTSFRILFFFFFLKLSPN